MGLFVSHLIALNNNVHRGRCYTELGVFNASSGTLRREATSSIFCRVVGYNALLFLTGPRRNQSARPFIFLYTTSPLVPTQEPALDSRLPLTHRERLKERDRERQKERKPTLLIPMHGPFPFSCKLIQGLEENLKKQAITRAWLVFVLPIIHYDLASVLQTVIIGLTASFPCRKKYALYGDMTMFLDEVIGDNKLNYWPFLASHCIFCTFINCIHSHKLLISSWKLKETLKDYQVMLSVFSFSHNYYYYFFLICLNEKFPQISNFAENVLALKPSKM